MQAKSTLITHNTFTESQNISMGDTLQCAETRVGSFSLSVFGFEKYAYQYNTVIWEKFTLKYFCRTRE